MQHIKKLITCLFCYGSAAQLQAQTDTIVTLQGKRVAVIITEITLKDVIYKIPNKPDLPLFHYKRNDVADIIFKDGSTINPMFNTVNPYDKIDVAKAKTILYFTPSKLFQNHIGIAYEHVFRKNLVGLRIPLSVSFRDVSKFKPQGAYLNSSDLMRTFTTGIDVNFYPVKIGKFRYVTGIGFQFAQFAYQYYVRQSNYNYIPETRYGNHYSFIINNGFISQLTKHFVMSATMGTGLQYENNGNSIHTDVRLNATVNVGYMF